MTVIYGIKKQDLGVLTLAELDEYRWRLRGGRPRGG